MTDPRREPSLAVVVPSFRAPALLEACLESIDRARARIPDPPPVYVARFDGAENVDRLLDDRPWVTLVASPVSDVPRLRGAGMAAATTEWVAVTEDHCVADARWIEVLLEQVDGQAQVVGGGVGNARPGALNWGAYFSEYGFFSSARPPADGVALVTGANVMYGPEVRGRVARWAGEGSWEDVIHGRLANEGTRFRFVPEARVSQNDRYAFRSFCQDRYEHGHDYAVMRLREHPDASRALRLATIPLLPFVLTGRVAKAAARESPSAFVAALPFTFAFLGAWALGEAAGYWKGAPR